jgi:hypothetical protein
MNFLDTILQCLLWVLIVFIPFWLIGFVSRRLSGWLDSRAAAKALALSPDAPKPQLMPESTFVVEITEFAVTCHRPDGQTEAVHWDDLQKVDILTTSDGPLAPDVFWLLHGSNGGCVIPQGATGETELLHHLQALTDFDNGALINAMGSTQEAIFTCWVKSPVAEESTRSAEG